MKKKLVVLTGALIVLMISSSLSYEQSTIIPILKNLLKNQPLNDILSLLKIPYWGRIVSVESEGYFGFLEFLIRKSTHIVGFGLIGAIMYWLLPSSLRWRGFIIILLLLCVAIADEFRQSFTPGRYMTYQDVLLDTFGVLLAISILKIREIFIKNSNYNQ